MSEACCQDPTPHTPEARANPPGQSALSYRAGTHASFKAAMKAALSRQIPLEGLTTRSDDDPAIALLDAASTMLDVLTFYQERIANEGFLRTATERLSLLEMARSIGYELRPGVAASAHLAFELETAPGSAPGLTLEAGVRAQSIPGPGEQPQTFETIEKIEARGEWNSLQPQISLPFRPTRATRSVTLQGASTNLKSGDFLLVVGDERLKDLGSEQWDFRRIQSIQVDPQANLTQVTFDAPLGWELPPYLVNPAGKNVRVFAFRARAALFGHNAPDWRLLPDDIQARFKPKKFSRKVSISTNVTSEWPGFDLDTSANELDLDALYPSIVPGSWGVLTSPDYAELCQVGEVSERAQANFGLTAKTTHLKLAMEKFDQFSKARRSALFYAQSEELAVAESPLVEIPVTAPSHGLPLSDSVLAPLEGGEILLARVVSDFPHERALAVSGRRMRVRVTAASLALAASNGTIKTVAEGESLLLWAAPLRLDSGLLRLTLQDKAGFLGTADVTGAQVCLVPADADRPVGQRGGARGALRPGRGRGAHAHRAATRRSCTPYDRATVTIQGNLALATHGETRREVLGSADAARAFQRFTLKQTPLTYHLRRYALRGAPARCRCASTTCFGLSTALAVRVRSGRTGVHRAPGATTGKASVQFGDGLQRRAPAQRQREHRRRLPRRQRAGRQRGRRADQPAAKPPARAERR